MFIVLFNISIFSLCEAVTDSRLPITVTAKINKTSITLGERIGYCITISSPRDFEVELADIEGKFGDFDVVDFSSKESSFFGKRTKTADLLLTIFQAGEFKIPKIAIKYRKSDAGDWSEYQIDQRVIEVKSLLEEEGKDAALRDIKGPVNPRARFNFIFILGIFLLLAAVIILALSLLRKKVAEAPVYIRPAHEVACEQLEALRRKDLIRQGKIKDYFSEVSDIIRRYLENRFNLRAPEMTTEEFLVHVRDYAQLISEHKSLLREFLSSCDLVKFAKYSPSGEEIELVFDSAKKFIDQTKQEEKEPER